MAGKPGRSGGVRSGAGRPKNPKPQTVVIESEGMDMLTLLQQIALGHIEASPNQIRAAIAAVQYTHAKKGDVGKKEEQAEAAKKVASKFSAATPPKLVAAGGRKV